MYAITGITGKVGGELARTLLASGQPVRAIVRDAQKGEAWAARGCEVAVAALEDPVRLSAAFAGASAVFVLPPPEFDPQPGYPEVRRVIDSVVRALSSARPSTVLELSTIGADAVHDNLLSQHTLFEAALRELGLPLTILRPAWFIDNAEWDVAPAQSSGVLHSFLQPLAKALPMVAAKDVGLVAAELIQKGPASGVEVVELEGPSRVSPNDLAAAFARALSKPVQALAVPRASWEPLFLEQGMKNPVPRMRMLDGFNEGWIEFRGGENSVRKGHTPVDAVISQWFATR
jgi:uncharacterized protein YbjT (DUF2867 family)